MRIKLVFILSIAILFCGLYVESVCGAGAIFDLAYSYQTEDFRWNIAGDLNGQNPNVLSELTWSGIKANQLKIGLESNLGHNLFLKGFFAPGRVGYGLVRDSDYLGDNRTAEFSRTVSLNSGDTLLDTSLVLGLNLLRQDNFQIRSMLGYSFSGQKLRITDGIQVIPETGPIAELNSTYQTKWYGPLLGTEITARFGKKTIFVNSVAYHWANYNAVGDWNLRDDLNHPQSFLHTAQGRGIVVSTGVEIALNKSTAVLLNANYQKWMTGPGVDRIFLVDGAEDTTRFNGSGLETFGMMAGIKGTL